MTEEYKNLLFDYLTGNITTTSSSTNEVILKQTTPTIDLMSHLTNATNYRVNGIVEGSNNYVMYGGYDTNNDTWLGFIALLDFDFNLVEVITTFSSGTALREISSLEMAEDNTFYGVDYEGSYTARFIMLNNFTIPNANGNYVVKLRTSYNFNDTDFLAQIGIKIFKNPNSSHYVFIGATESNFTLKIIELKIVVGATNEWTSYNSPNYEFYMNGYVDFDSNDNAYISTVGINASNQVRLVYKNYTATALNSTLIEQATGDPYMYYNSPVAFIGKNKFYYTWTDDNSSTTYLKYYDSGVSLIQSLVNVNMFLTSKNGELYLGYDYAPNASLTASQFYYQRYTGTWSPMAIPGYNSYMQDGYMFIVSQYNILNIFTFDNLNSLQILGLLLTEDYNKANYNSLPYIDGTSIYPQKARLYQNNTLEFARNIYNISSLGNTYTITTEIPNVFLNNSSFYPNQIVSKTNQIIMNSNIPLTKNIYEKVFLNFVNTINAYDEDTGIDFDTTDLVKNVSSLGENYSNSYIRYWNTTKNGNEVDSGTIDTYTYLGRLTGEFYISFTPTGEADILNFMNNNGEIYGWIDISNCIPGITYDIHQKVRLADIPLGDQHVIWDNKKVQFNGNDVIYYTSI